MTEEQISSPANPLLKRARKLRTTKHRKSEGATFVEGIAPAWEALDHAEVEVLLVALDLLKGEEGCSLVDRARQKDVRVAHLTPEAFGSIAERDNPSGVAAIARTTKRYLSDVEVGQKTVLVVLENVAGPGNLGTIVRTADAVDAEVVVTGDSTDPWHPACVKASMGTVFSRRVVEAGTIEDVAKWCTSTGVATVTTSARAQDEHWAADYPLPVAIFLGSERHGLAPDDLALGDKQVRIPMNGDASSLNLAVAAGILLYEIRRPRS